VVSAYRYRRGDGTVMHPEELLEAIPMLACELEDLAWLLDLLWQWLRIAPDARHDLSEFLAADASPTTCGQLIGQLDATNARLHRLVTSPAGGYQPRHP
jgi:hypothetical protein